MTPREMILAAFEGEKTQRVPVTLFGGGMWSIREYGSTFKDLSQDAEKMANMLVSMSGRLLCDVVYAGSGYNNFHAAALGGRIKFREMGAPDLEEPFVTAEEDLQKLDLTKIDSNDVITTIIKALKTAKSKIGNDYMVTMTAWGPFTLGANIIKEKVSNGQKT